VALVGTDGTIDSYCCPRTSSGTPFTTIATKTPPLPPAEVLLHGRAAGGQQVAPLELVLGRKPKRSGSRARLTLPDTSNITNS
jgi:hypothetical protein